MPLVLAAARTIQAAVGSQHPASSVISCDARRPNLVIPPIDCLMPNGNSFALAQVSELLMLSVSRYRATALEQYERLISASCSLEQYGVSDLDIQRQLVTMFETHFHNHLQRVKDTVRRSLSRHQTNENKPGGFSQVRADGGFFNAAQSLARHICPRDRLPLHPKPHRCRDRPPSAHHHPQDAPSESPSPRPCMR